jgi:mycothione reductase
MKEYDLIVVGAGSGNMLPADGFNGWRIAIIEPDRMGGTCLNRGCIPSKCFVYTADVAATIASSAKFNLGSRLVDVDWPAIRDRIFARIDPLHQSAVDYRRANGIDVYTDAARFTGDRTLQVGSEAIAATHVVIASGSRPFAPAIPGLDSVHYETSDTVMRLNELPASMVIVGGGYIAAEMAHIFGALGTKVTVVNRSSVLLGAQDHSVSTAFTDIASTRWNVHLNSTVTSVAKSGAGVRVEIQDCNDSSSTHEADVLLLATGRIPNTDILDVAAAGVEVDGSGYVIEDSFGRTNKFGVWTLGDASNHFQLKHVANAQARAVWHNIERGDDLRAAKLGVVPSAVFTSPQISSVGETETELRSRGADYLTATQPYGATAYGWAMEDTTSFAKVLIERESLKLLGAHIMGPQASLILQPVVQAMSLGNTADQLANDVMYAHPVLTEVLEQALLEALA